MAERERIFIRFGVALGALLAFVGYFLAVALVFAVLPSINPEALWIFVGAFIGVMYCGAVGGGIAARFIYDGTNPYWCGMVLAVASALVPTFCLALPFALSAASWGDFARTLFMPLYFVWLFGGLPMLILGMIYGSVLRRREERLVIVRLWSHAP